LPIYHSYIATIDQAFLAAVSGADKPAYQPTVVSALFKANNATIHHAYCAAIFGTDKPAYQPTVVSALFKANVSTLISTLVSTLVCANSFGQEESLSYSKNT
jgi:hypothetical protein